MVIRGAATRLGLQAALICAVSSCARTGGGPEPSTADAGSPEPEGVLCDAVLVPANATEIHSPQNINYFLSGTTSDWGGAELTELASDGTEVDAGVVVAEFDYWSERYLPQFMERIESAEASARRAAVDLASERDELRTDLERKTYEADIAKLDTRKERAVSRRDADLLRIDLERALFEAEAAAARLEAHEAHAEAEMAYHRRKIARAEMDLERYRFHERQHEVRAPHAGVVRHVIIPNRHRKAQKGDGMACGTHFLSIARDEDVAVEVFVPEHRVEEVSAGDEVRILSLSSDDEYTAVVSAVDPFPQEIGFLREDDELPNAREKVYVVSAEFDEQPEGLSAGLETKVRLP